MLCIIMHIIIIQYLQYIIMRKAALRNDLPCRYAGGSCSECGTVHLVEFRRSAAWRSPVAAPPSGVQAHRHLAESVHGVRCCMPTKTTERRAFL